MRVLHVLPSISRKLGGPTEVAIQLVKNLNQKGISAEIATTNDLGPDVLNLPNYALSQYLEVPVWSFPRERFRRREFIPSRALANWLYTNVRNYDIVDIHYLFTFSSTVAGYCAKYHNVPYTMRAMGQLAPWSLSQRRLIKTFYSLLLEKRLLNDASVVHCTSFGEAEDVKKYKVKSPLEILPLGVEETEILENAPKVLRERFAIPNDSSIILFHSRLHPKKRPDVLIKEYHNFKSTKPIHIILAGDGEPKYVQELKEIAVEKNIEKYVHFVGFIDKSIRSELLQGCDIFVLPSSSDNFALALAEALEAGAAVITTTSVQIAPDLIEAQSGVVINSVGTELVNAVNDLLADPQKRKRLGENARNMAHEKYSWPNITDKLVEVYQRIVK
jgi:glycosyltransferase involved in cell wall biosynthesis